MAEVKEETVLSPLTFWAQRKDRILLRVNLHSLKSKHVDIQPKSLTLDVVGTGQNGEKRYKFDLKLFDELDVNNCHQKVRESYLDLSLLKRNAEWWPRLLAGSGQVPPFIRVDFDRWVDPDDDEEEESEEHDEPSDIKSMMNKFASEARKKQKGDERQQLGELATFVLFIYNLVQLVMCCVLVGCLTLGAATASDGVFFSKVYSNFVGLVTVSTMMTSLEILFAALKFTPGGVLNPLFQVGGRSLALAVLIYADEVAHSRLCVFQLFYVWGLADVIRFCYLMFSVIGHQFSGLTWLRYTMWLPLYPLGFGLELVNIMGTVGFYSEKALVDRMPYPYLIYSYIPISVMGFLKLYMHMFKVRRKKLLQPSSPSNSFARPSPLPKKLL